MKIVSIYGSPNKSGNSASIADAVIRGIDPDKHRVSKIYLHDLDFRDCTDCTKAYEIHQEKNCIHDDDFTNRVLPELLEAELLIISSPVYMGQITGILKSMFDRFYTFIGKDMKIRVLPGKKYVTIITSGAPDDTFYCVTEYLEHWLGDFFKMEKMKQFHAGNLMGTGSIREKRSILEDAEEFGKTLI